MTQVSQFPIGEYELPCQNGSEERFDALFNWVITHNVSDIHIEPVSYAVKVRMRINGILHTHALLVPSDAQQIINRLKVIGGMDIAQAMLPQDGSFRLVHGKHASDIRLSTFPTVYGEKVVIRVLSDQDQIKSIRALGFDDTKAAKLSLVAQQTSGLFLVSGPTGSGKTTTLYAMMQTIDTKKRNVATLEDPIEYRMTNINQTQVQTGIDFTFSVALRALLRQDPDVAMIGEIRDLATAQVGLEAALTGHLVFSTVHTGNAIQSILRLVEMGVEQHMIVACLKAVLAQRLIPQVCQNCSKRQELSVDELHWCKQRGWKLAQSKVPTGCESCSYTGYDRRILISELLVLNDELRVLCMQNGLSLDLLRDECKRQEMETLADQAYQALLAGRVTLADVMALGL